MIVCHLSAASPKVELRARNVLLAVRSPEFWDLRVVHLAAISRACEPVLSLRAGWRWLGWRRSAWLRIANFRLFAVRTILPSVPRKHECPSAEPLSTSTRLCALRKACPLANLAVDRAFLGLAVLALNHALLARLSTTVCRHQNSSCA